jgi:hypothetical protein
MKINRFNEAFGWGKKKKLDPTARKSLDQLPPEKEKPWRQVIEDGDDSEFDDWTNFYRYNCGGSHSTFLRYLEKLCIGRRVIVEVSHENYIGGEVYFKEILSNDKKSTAIEVHVVDSNGVDHFFPVGHKIVFRKVKKVVTKEDPYGEEVWDD